jgi:hypothetical protein
MLSLVGARRKTQRMACVVEARVLLADRPSVPCTVRDVTPDGAKLVFLRATAVPNKILVLIPSIGEAWAAQVCWRRGPSLGVRFIRGEADLPAAADNSASDTFALRLQAAQLSRTAKRLSA